MKDLTGVYTAIVTPFLNGEIDFESLKKVIRFQLDGSINGLVICGTTGESPTLSDIEKEKVFRFVKAEVAGQVPLMMGTGTNSTSESIRATQAAESWGADAALVVVPYYNRPPQRGLFSHYQKIAQCSNLPIMLYNVPSRTITQLELETVVELSRVPNVIGIKEASGDLEFGRQIVQGSNRDFVLTSGDDATFIDLISVGSKGVISVASNILPRQFSEWCSQTRKGEVQPRVEFEKFRSLNSNLYVEANPIPIKMALALMGIIRSPEMRLPLVTLAEPKINELKVKLAEVGLV